MVIISIEGNVVPIMFPVEDDGYVDVSASRLALRFHMIPESIYIDQNIYDPESGILSHTIGQTLTPTTTGRTWRLLPGKFTAYGLKVSVQADFDDLCHLHPLLSSLHTATIMKDVKVERIDPHITLLSDDSDEEPPPPLGDGNQSSHVSIPSTSRDAQCTPLPAHVDRSSSSVLEFLRALRTLKGS